MNESKDNCDEISNSQQNFQKSRKHEKCNLPTTLMRTKIAIRNIQISRNKI